jgi:outer membrane protein W
VSDISLGVEGRWWLLRGKAYPRTFRPFLGAGLAAHAVNVEGAGLGDSFVEDGLDQIAVGVVGNAGLDIAILPNFLLTMLARYDLFSGVRHATARAGFSYVLDAGATR